MRDVAPFSKCLVTLLLHENLAWINSKCSDWVNIIARLLFLAMWHISSIHPSIHILTEELAMMRVLPTHEIQSYHIMVLVVKERSILKQMSRVTTGNASLLL